ncbi:pre-mRNA-splicing factor CWC21-like [Phragmites australis]|uniref:pre-mRNA-splicing factor CWC21-like n=1 Tax=Phragmites australis TaxID=29695 RepID=UPI002D776ABB|nr:pre-mRNA-splicing factor CWC21-like [Phragmites australis]
MYNGIGLQTPRGSGTSGHVQASKFLVKHRPSSSSAAGGSGPPGPGDAAGGLRKPSKDILEHDRKRQVELRLLVLRDALEEQGYTEGEIEERVVEVRKASEIEAAAAAAEEEGRPPLQGKGFTDRQSHHAAARKEKQLESLRAALGPDDEDAHKMGAESVMEPGELVPGKCSDEELDTDGHKDSKTLKGL